MPQGSVRPGLTRGIAPADKHAGGQRFESAWLHFNILISICHLRPGFCWPNFLERAQIWRDATFCNAARWCNAAAGKLLTAAAIPGCLNTLATAIRADRH